MDAKVKGAGMADGAAAPLQRIARLTPLDEAFAALERLATPVAPRTLDAVDAVNCVLAADVVAQTLPARATALTDGFAVRADETADASSYAAVPLAAMPGRVESGDDLPPQTDAVAPAEIITVTGSRTEAIAAVTPGEGVLPAGGDADPAQPLRCGGERLRAIDIPVLAAAKVTTVSARTPRLRIISAREDLRLQPALQLVAQDCAALGARALVQNGAELHAALRGDDDALIIIGGTGAGERDDSVFAMAKAGTVAIHGIGLAPGDTAALGAANNRAVLALPGRLDAALAGWLVLGRALLARLAGSTEAEPAVALKLSRKITSTVGLAEFIPVRRIGEEVEPLAAKYLPKYLPLSALARADGWLLVPAQSEGYAAGTPVMVKSWPK
jgi:molybdopterin biosynthesis enzyme